MRLGCAGVGEELLLLVAAASCAAVAGLE